MATPSSPTARSRELGRRLKELRESRGKTLADIAEELSCSQAKVSRMETGQRPVQALDIKVLCRFYGLPEREQDQLTHLAAESRKRGWWQDIDYLDDNGKTFLGLEAAATQVWLLEVLRAPGLLQAPEYTSAWVTRMRPPGWYSPEALDELLEVRRRRQSRISEGSLHLRALIDERVFLTENADFAHALLLQLERLWDAASLPNVEVRLIPLSAGPHPGLDGSFHLLRFPAGESADVIFIEGQYGNFLLDKPADIARYREVFDLATRLALSEADTQAWFHRRHRELTDYLESTHKVR